MIIYNTLINNNNLK